MPGTRGPLVDALHFQDRLGKQCKERGRRGAPGRKRAKEFKESTCSRISSARYQRRSNTKNIATDACTPKEEIADRGGCAAQALEENSMTQQTLRTRAKLVLHKNVYIKTLPPVVPAFSSEPVSSHDVCVAAKMAEGTI